jgi:ribonuclease Z
VLETWIGASAPSEPHRGRPRDALELGYRWRSTTSTRSRRSSPTSSGWPRATRHGRCADVVRRRRGPTPRRRPGATTCGPGFEAGDAAAFDSTLARLSAAGFDPTRADGGPGDAGSCEARRVEQLATVAAPWGSSVEVVLRLERRPGSPATPLLPGGFMFVAFSLLGPDLGIRYVLLLLPGLWIAAGALATGSRWSSPRDRPRGPLLPCSARHHTLALARAPFEMPQALHHIMFETNDRDDVGRARSGLRSRAPLTTAQDARQRPDVLVLRGQPPGFQVEVGHEASRSPSRGRTTGAMTGSAPGATSPSRLLRDGRGHPHRHRRPHPRPGRPARSAVRCARRVAVRRGRATVLRLMEAAPPTALSALFVTHVHSDHVVDLPDVAMTGGSSSSRPHGSTRDRRPGEPARSCAACSALRRRPRGPRRTRGADPLEVDLRPFEVTSTPELQSGPAMTGRSGAGRRGPPRAGAGGVAYRSRRPTGSWSFRRHPGLLRSSSWRPEPTLVHEACRTTALAEVIAGTTFETSSATADTVPLGAMAERAGAPVVLTHHPRPTAGRGRGLRPGPP